MTAIGNLRDSPLGDILLRLQRERRSGVLRLRNTAPDGLQRIDLVLRDGKLIGAARCKSGGVHGMGDALVDEALAAPEDAAAALDYAESTCQHPIGALLDGATRVGVSYERVVQTLAAHIEHVLNEARGWSNGNGEFVLDGFPADAVDPESASARAFVLDDGIPPSRLVGVPDPGDFEATEPGSAEFMHPDELGNEPTAEAPPAPMFAAPPTSPENDDWFAAPAPSPAPAKKTEPPKPAAKAEPTKPAAKAEPPTASPKPEPLKPTTPPAETPDERRERIRRIGAAAREARRRRREDAAAKKPPTSPFAESVAASDKTRPSIAIAAPPPAAVEEEEEPEENDDGPDEGTAGVDFTTPGFGEAALMEAEQLLDSEVLGVMLEMGSSAAQAAKAAVEKVETGHVLLIDDEGLLLPLLVPAMRDAGLVVHTITGLSEALERMNEVASEGVRPLVVCDLLIKRGDEGGMLGGIDVARHARGLSPELPVVLLAETMSDDVRKKAEEQGVKSLLSRPLRAELKKDEAARESFMAELLAAVDQHRPRAEWAAPADNPWATRSEDGWDVAAIEEKARDVDDIPGLDSEDRTHRIEALWRESMHALSGPLSQPEILLVLLRFAAEVFQRAVIFTPVGVELVGFGQFGVELAPGVDPDQAVREIRLPPDGHPGIHACVVQRIAQRMPPGESTWELYLTRALGGIAPDEAFFGPVFCQGRLAAVIYGDSLGTDGSLPETTSNLEVVLGQAGLALDRAVLEARLKALEGKGG